MVFIQNEIDNKIGDEGCMAIFVNAGFITNLEKLNLRSNYKENY